MSAFTAEDKILQKLIKLRAQVTDLENQLYTKEQALVGARERADIGPFCKTCGWAPLDAAAERLVEAWDDRCPHIEAQLKESNDYP